MPNIVFLDGFTTNPGDLSWQPLGSLGNLKIFDRTPAELTVERAAEAEIILTNKVVLDQQVLEKLPRLQLICVAATGYNIIDVSTARQRGVVVCNARGYAANSVAQHVFALLLELTNRVAAHDENVRQGGWARSADWSYTLCPTLELAGKTFGIYGFGQIGQKVAEIAQAFGMKILACHKHPERDARPGVEFVSFEKMMQESDVVSLHAPLTAENQGIVNLKTLSLMKPTAFFINTGRGGLVVEDDLKQALESGMIAGAGLDVLSQEPPRSGNVLIGAKNCIVTPHNAWATKESRARLIEECVKNVEAFLADKPRNQVE